MNFLVHSIMYFYYFCTAIGLYKYVAWSAPFITTIQLLQMLGGWIFTFYVAKFQYEATAKGIKPLEACQTATGNWKLAMMMYTSYFILFAILFFDKYIASSKP